MRLFFPVSLSCSSAACRISVVATNASSAATPSPICPGRGRRRSHSTRQTVSPTNFSLSPHYPPSSFFEKGGGGVKNASSADINAAAAVSKNLPCRSFDRNNGITSASLIRYLYSFSKFSRSSSRVGRAHHRGFRSGVSQRGHAPANQVCFFIDKVGKWHACKFLIPDLSASVVTT